MPRLPTVIEIRLDNITTCLNQALLLLTELNDAFGPPFVQLIANIVQGLINLVQNVKRNKTECAQLMEHIHQIVYAIINLHIKSETVDSLPPSMLDHIGQFMETLRKIYIFVEAQQEGNRIKHLLHNNEMKKLLQDCLAGLNRAMEVFGIQTGAGIMTDSKEFKCRADLMHKELTALIEMLSDASTLSEKSSVHRGVNELQNSSNSFSLLPSKPKIFHGREQELENVLKLLSQKSPRIAILGGGGMGKTSLARAALHHPDTSSKFEHRFFISAEAATSSIELAALVGLHLGLNPGADLTKAVIHYFAQKPSSLLILDNLETVWEAIQARSGVENFLSLLSEVEQLALMITMRGAERPANVQWTHPFLLPLQPLSKDAAKQTFIDITDNSLTLEEVDKLLQFTDNMPLAVDLVAHLTDYEGCSNVLSRWEREKTSMLSVGFDRRSSLDASISLSLSSPRITSDSKKLLSLLSILPNGLSEAELVQSELGIPNILICKAALQATSLVHQNGNRQLLLLMPVREYVKKFLPPSQFSLQAILKHFCGLLELYSKYRGEQLHPLIQQITMNLANLHEVLTRGLHDSDSNLADAIYHTLILNSFYRITGRNSTSLMDDIPSPLPQPQADKLGINLLIELLSSSWDPKRHYMMHYMGDSHQAIEFMKKAVESSRVGNDSYHQSRVLSTFGWVKYQVGDISTGQVYFSAAQKLSKLSGNFYQEALSTLFGAICSLSLGHYQESGGELHRARELLRLSGWSGARLDLDITLNQAEIHRLKSEYIQAQNMYRGVAETTSTEENALPHALALLNIALIDMEIGGDEKNIYHNLNVARAVQSRGGPQAIAPCDMLEANMELLEGKFDSAKAKFLECLTSKGAQIETNSFCLGQLANIKAWPAGGWQYKWSTIYLGHAYKSKEKLALHKALLFLGDLFVENGDEETATSLYQVALAGFTFMDVHQSRAQCMLRLGDLANKHGLTSEAITLWNAAKPLFERSLQTKDVAKIDSQIATVENAHTEVLVQLESLHAPAQFPNEETSGFDADNCVVPVSF
ncbi:hypothetical protein K438DRAFT_1788449 [Mycena galopus ATCC 62051]|nr:hypothetical protein K438DRAFT_1788449 [Mycena galopus ATCC 62051]